MSDMNDWKEQLAKLRGSAAPPKDAKKDKPHKGKPSSKKPPGDRKSPPSRRSGGGRGDDRYFLPADTLELLQPELGSKRQKVDNFALLLNKCALFDDRPKQKKFILARPEERRRGVEGYRLTPNFHPAGVEQIAARHEQAINKLEIETVKLSPLTVDWRLIVGLGAESVYETSMTLHHIYGIPYIPGQAVKGVLRSWLILEHFTENKDGEFDLKKAEDRALGDPGFRRIFGAPEQNNLKACRGEIVFFDAFPTHLNKDSIQPDIMNPHYGPYYDNAKQPPADYHNPVPVTFLTVVNTTFEFFVGFKPLNAKTAEIQGGEFDGTTPLSLVQKLLPAALSEHGLGAKTAVGYGYFSQE
jgi:CRISPR-associated protein Cmr6